MEMKKCTKCGVKKPATVEWFVKQKTGKNGLKATCKECDKKYRKENQEKMKEYKEKNKEILKVKNKEYRNRNQEKISKWNNENKEWRREYKKTNQSKIQNYNEVYKERKRYLGKLHYLENKEYYSENNKKWKENNKTYMKEYSKEYRKNNKEKIQELATEWRKNNRDSCNMRNQHRRAIKKQLPNNLTLKQWQSTKDHFNHECAYCGKQFKNLHQDHFWPLSRGGGYTKFNILPACPSCNSSKNNKQFEEWYPTHESYSPEREAKIYRYFEHLALENGGWGRTRHDLGVVTIEVQNENM